MKLQRLMPLVLGVVAISSLSGCKTVVVGGEQTIQIKAYKAGYGVDWLTKATEEFKKANPNIDFVFEETSALVGDKFKNEINSPSENQIDLYFVNTADIDYIISNSKKILKNNDKVLLEPLDDLFNSKAINAKGQEEDVTIASKFLGGFKEAVTYESPTGSKWDNKMFTLPWAQGMTGVFYNSAILEKFDIDLPRTSDEFIAAVKTIHEKNKDLKDAPERVYPYSWAGSNAPGYWNYLYETWFAQYSGQKGFESFMRCEPKDHNIKEHGYQVYQDEGILKSLEAMIELLNLDYSPNGSASKKHIEAQTEFVTGKSAFMIDGDWLLNEMKEYYFEQTKEIKMLRTPILSSIGPEVGLSDDAQLHTLVDLIDAHKSNEDIKKVLPMLNDNGIERVKEARSITCSQGVSHNIFIPSYCDAIDVAKKFVRFLYSEDGCRIFRDNAYSNLPVKYQKDEASTNTPFQQSLDLMRDYDDAKVISDDAGYNNVRNQAQLYLFNYQSWVSPNTFKSVMMNNAKKDVDKFTAQVMFEKEASEIEKNWSSRMSFVF